MSSKRQERIYLDWFLQNAGIACERIQEEDPPDFVLFCDNRKIAAEVTRIFAEPVPGRTGSKSREDESRRAQWLQNLAKSYYQKTDVPIWVRVLFPGQAESYADSTADILSFLLRSSELAVYGQERYELDTDTTQGTVKLFVSRLPADKDCCKHYSRWECMNDHMGFAPPLSEDHIGNAVRKKERSLSRYRARYNEAWLLIVVDGSWRSGILDVPAAIPRLKECRFDCVWLVEYLDKVEKLFP